MNKILLLRIALSQFVFVFLFINTLSAQDVHFTQFYHSPSNLNPALTGVFHGDERFIVNYRNQWANVPVDYTTFAGAYDGRINPKFLGKKTIGVGAQFYYDQAGDSNLFNTKLVGSAAYIHHLNERNALSGGLGLGFSFRGYSSDNLNYNSQFDGEIFNENLASGEDDLLDTSTKFFLDVSLGVNWHHNKKKYTRSTLDAGVALFHLNRPAVNLYNGDKEKLDGRFNLFIDGTQQLHRRFDVRGRGLAQFKGPESELLLGLAGRFFLEPHRSKFLAIQLGIAYRIFDEGDAWAPSIEFQYKSWTLGFSYDLNVSEFQAATNKNGGPELALIYRTAKAKTLDAKNCKIF